MREVLAVQRVNCDIMTAFRSARAARLLASTRPSASEKVPPVDNVRIWKIWLSLTFLFDSLVAVALSVFELTPGSFYVNFVFSQCIGLLTCISILIPRGFLSRLRRHRALITLLLAVLGMITGLIAGRALAAAILGQPLDWRTGVVEDSSTFMVSLVVSVFGTATGIVYFWTREREAVLSMHTAEVREKAEIVARELTETQLRLLRAQIEPHMLFNTLSNLRALIAQDPPAAQKMLDRLIDFFRASLDASRSEWTSLQREFDLASDYLNLIAVRLGSRLKFELDLPDDLGQLSIPSMLIQPLVENAVKHGIEPALDGGNIRLQARRTGKHLEISIRDDGVGLTQSGSPVMSGKPQNAGGGYGTEHLRERLYNLYGESALFDLSPVLPHGTLVKIVLPIGGPFGQPEH